MEFKKSIVLLIPKRLKFITGSQELVIQFFSNKLNTKSYNRLNKKIADFKEPESEPVMPHNTKYFHHQNRKDTDNNKKHKTYTQH